jgi:hypothetical protein
MYEVDRIKSILAAEIECGVFEQHVVPALETARKVLAEPVAWVYRYRDGSFSTRIFLLPPDESDVDSHTSAGGSIVPLYAGV